MGTVDSWASNLRRDLVSAARPSAFDLRAYLGSPLPVLAVRVPEIRRVAASFERLHPTLTRTDLHRLVRRLWKGTTFEERALAILLLRNRVRDLGEDTWAMLDRWVDHATGWGLCDDLASGPIAALVLAEPRRVRALLTWTRSSNFWRRRAALYALNGFVRSGDLSTALQVIDRLREDPEFWVQRAVGTWLRECWKKDAPRIRRYLDAHVAELPPVALTVATERAPRSYRARLRARARAARRSTPTPS